MSVSEVHGRVANGEESDAERKGSRSYPVSK